MSENTVNPNENIDNNTENQIVEKPGIIARAKGLPWKKISLYGAGTALVVVGGIFAYNGLMEKVVEVATEAAEKVAENAEKAVEVIEAVA